MVAPGGGIHGCSGGCAWLLLGGHAWFFGGHAWFLVGGMHGFFGGRHAWFFLGGMRRIRRDTVNERAVRILLECILVHYIFLATIIFFINFIEAFHNNSL